MWSRTEGCTDSEKGRKVGSQRLWRDAFWRKQERKSYLGFQFFDLFLELRKEKRGATIALLF